MIDLSIVGALVGKEMRDARRNRWLALYTLVFAGLSFALAWLALATMGAAGPAGFGRTAASLVNFVLLIVPLMGLTLGALSLASERERGSLLYLLAQPITHLELLMGKYLGVGLSLLGALALGFGASGLVIAWRGIVASAAAYLALVALASLLALSALSLGMFLSALARRSATAIALALFLWLLLVFGGDLGLMGSALVLRIDIQTLFALALLNPLQVFKMAAILAIRGSLEVLGPAGLYALRAYGDRLSLLFLVILLAWAILPLAFTYLIFRQRGAL